MKRKIMKKNHGGMFESQTAVRVRDLRTYDMSENRCKRTTKIWKLVPLEF